jgi:putative ABC transport system substrate-binding protein
MKDAGPGAGAIVQTKRRFLTLAAAAALLQATATRSRADALRPLRIGYIVSGPQKSVFEEQFELGLRDNGYSPGTNAIIDYRYQARPDVDISGEVAALVAAKVDAIVVSNRNAALAAKAATTTIPIIFGATRDAIQDGLVQSLARPEANVTGQSFHSGELSAKRVQLMREAFPQSRKFAVLFNTHYPSQLQLDEAARAQASLGIELVVRGIKVPDEIEETFRRLKADGVAAAFIVSDLTTITNRTRIGEAAIKEKMPLMLSNKRYLTGGGLMSYGPDISEGFRRAARQLVRAANGTPIHELPVEQPTRFEFLVDQRAARAIGVELPLAIIARVDEVIE